MIRVTIEQKRGPVTRRVAVTAPSIARALELAGAGRDGIEAKVLFPIDPDTYFVPEGSGESAAPVPPGGCGASPWAANPAREERGTT
jgi:hypothetical protein